MLFKESGFDIDGLFCQTRCCMRPGETKAKSQRNISADNESDTESWPSETQ